MTEGSTRTAEVVAITEGLIFVKKKKLGSVAVVTDSAYCHKAGRK